MRFKIKAVAGAVLALGLIIGSGAYAQRNPPSPYDQGGGSHYRGQGKGQVYRNGPPPQLQYRGQGPGPNHADGQSMPPQYRGGARGPGYVVGYHGQYRRGAGPDRGYYRGARVPTEYRSRQFVVDD